MIKADVLVNNKAWKKHISNPSSYLKNKLKKLEKKINIFKKNKLNFTLLLSGNNQIKKLNNEFRKKNKITDILSFPFHEKKILYKLLKKNKNNIYLGDIIINLNEITKQSKNQKFLSIFDKIWIHGLTHLLGYRHNSNQDFSVMQKLENKIIKSIQ
jgi:probable rRNA maturation factor|tara:strand:- start:2736 stop:3203 length:468 start_codon:yes stop_codon:yes gene_type:complete